MNRSIVFLAADPLKRELESRLGPAFQALRRAATLDELVGMDADAYLDLDFEPEPGRLRRLKALLPRTVVINSVMDTLQETHPDFIRLNAWPGFVDRPLAEIALASPEKEAEAQALFNALNWPLAIVPDRAGMIGPRVISMIINEAFYAWQDRVSSRESIDTAMRLGTGYPFGPFEWSRRIGLDRIYRLLGVLQQTDGRYAVAATLEQEALNAAQ